MSIVILSLMTGCQSLNLKTDFNSANSKPPVGTVIQLRQTLSFPQGTSRSYIQHGKTKVFSDVDDRQPWCQFYRYEPQIALKTVRTIEPDNFIISHSRQTIEFASIQPVMVVASNLFLPFINDDDPSSRTLSTVMRIRSDKQPEVVEFKCAVFDAPYSENFVSVNQIIQTLGDVVTLKFK